MAVTAVTFRTDLPEFASAAKYPDTMISFWLGVADKLISADRWGDLYDTAVELFIAHNIVMGAADVASSSAGGNPGGAAGIVSSKAVGSVNVSYDTASAMELNAGHWNQTDYGRRYIRLARMIGAGCVQL